MNKLIKILVGIAALVMIYLCVMSVYTPVQFVKEKAQREKVIQKKLKAISTLEQAYENIYHKYADAQHLQWFLQEGKLYYIKAEGEYTDEMRDKKITEREAVRQGLLRRDTVWVPVADTLLKNSGITAANLFNVPFSKNPIKLETDFITQTVGDSEVKVPVFRASLKFKDYLGDLDKVSLSQAISSENAKANGFPGLVLGSLKEVKTTGNWE